MKYLIKKESKIPSVDFDVQNSVIIISGIIAPENPDIFFNALNNEFISIYNNYSPITIDFKLDYFNTGSARYLYLFLKKISNYNNIDFIWRYEENDEEIFESGKELENLCNIKFKFVKI